MLVGLLILSISVSLALFVLADFLRGRLSVNSRDERPEKDKIV